MPPSSAERVFFPGFFIGSAEGCCAFPCTKFKVFRKCNNKVPEEKPWGKRVLEPCYSLHEGNKSLYPGCPKFCSPLSYDVRPPGAHVSGPPVNSFICSGLPSKTDAATSWQLNRLFKKKRKAYIMSLSAQQFLFLITVSCYSVLLLISFFFAFFFFNRSIT